ncbi:MAG: hypothetical protein MI922_09920 [Bacteroidales bacterium]|nr:hypothetical protein [Bacteroidales bacterium]
MATRDTLKSYFQTGDKPSETQFAELIDSNFNKDDDTIEQDIENLENTKANLDDSRFPDDDQKAALNNALEPSLENPFITWNQLNQLPPPTGSYIGDHDLNNGLPILGSGAENTVLKGDFWQLNNYSYLAELQPFQDVAVGDLLYAKVDNASNVADFFVTRGSGKTLISGEADNETKDIYIKPVNGNDKTGDGSQANPFKTLKRAVLSLKSICTEKVSIYFDEPGSIDLDQETLNVFSAVAFSKHVDIFGHTTLVRDDFEARIHPNPDDLFVKNAVNKTDGTPMIWEENQYRGYLVRCDNYAPEYSFSVIGNHGPDTLSTQLFTSGWWGGAIYSMDNTLNFVDDRGSLTSFFTSQRSVHFQHFNIVSNTGKKLMILNESVIYSYCYMQIGSTINMLGASTILSSVIVKNNTTKNSIVAIKDSLDVKFQKNILIHDDPMNADPGTNGLVLNHSSPMCQKNYFIGLPTAILIQESVVLHKYGHYPNIFKDCGVVFGITAGKAQYVLGEYYGMNYISTFNCNYLFALLGATQQMHFVFDDEQIRGDAPNNGLFVPATGGEWQGNPTALTAVHDKPKAYIDPVRQNSFYVFGHLFPEIETTKEVSILNNTTQDLVVGKLSQNCSLEIDYILIRNGKNEKGKYEILDDSSGGILSFNSFIPDNRSSGINLSSFIENSDDITLRIELNDDIDDATFKFSIKRTMK